MVDSARISHFAPDGVYAGVPYRVLADCSIEAMLHGVLVKFKNMDHLIASATGPATVNGLSQPTKSYDLLGDTNERVANIPALGRPLDYYSLLQDAIKNTQQNSAQLRALVYERVRFNFKRDILFGHSSLGLADLVRHVNDFELAVARIEANATDNPTNLDRHQEKKHEHVTNDTELAEAVTGTDDEASATHREEAESPESAKLSSNAVQIMPPTPVASRYADFGSIQRINEFPYDHRSEDFWRYQRFTNQIIGILGTLGIVVIGTVIVAGLLGRAPTVPPESETASIPQKSEETRLAKNTPKETEEHTPKQDVVPKAPKLPYPVPTSYGIYALNDNKLVELKPLRIRVPDSRVAISAEITEPTSTPITADRPAFILFRRDLLTDAPQKMTLRVIARMARQTKVVNGTATVEEIESSWRIRNISHDLKVSPVPDQREMIIARLADDEPLAAGRYALNLNGVGYDFTVKGPIKSLEFCLEGFQTATNGSVFNQCRAP